MKVKKHFVVAPVRNGAQTISDNKLCLSREIRLPRNQQRKRKALTHLMTTLVHEASSSDLGNGKALCFVLPYLLNELSLKISSSFVLLKESPRKVIVVHLKKELQVN